MPLRNIVSFFYRTTKKGILFIPKCEVLTFLKDQVIISFTVVGRVVFFNRKILAEKSLIFSMQQVFRY